MSILIPVIKLPSQSTSSKIGTTTSATRATTTSSTAKVTTTAAVTSTAKTSTVVTTLITPTTSSSAKPATTSSTSSLKPSTTSSSTVQLSPSTSPSITSSTVASSSTVPSSSASPTSSIGLDGANAGSKNSSGNGLSIGVIIGIVAGAVVLVAIVAIFATRAIRKRQRSDRRRRSGLQAWTDRRSTLHGNDDDFFNPTAGVGAGVASSGHSEKPWGMEMTPSREKLDMYGPGGGYEQPMHPGQEASYAGTTPSSAQPLHSRDEQSYGQQDPYAGQWTAYPQHPAAAYGLATPGQTQYAPVSRSSSPGMPQEQYSGGQYVQQGPGVPVIVTHPAPEQAGQQTSNAPVAAAVATDTAVEHDPQLKDDMWVVVRSTFVRSLEDELDIQPNDQLYLIQAYDDGWCLCEDSQHARGFVPLYCLQQAAGATNGNSNAPLHPTLSLVPPSPTSQDGSAWPLSAGLISPVSPGVVGEGKTETLTFSQPVVLVNGQAQQGSAAIGTDGIPRSPSSNSLGAVSVRSQRRSSLFVDANTAGMYLNHQTAVEL